MAARRGGTAASDSGFRWSITSWSYMADRLRSRAKVPDVAQPVACVCRFTVPRLLERSTRDGRRDQRRRVEFREGGGDDVQACAQHLGDSMGLPGCAVAPSGVIKAPIAT